MSGTDDFWPGMSLDLSRSAGFGKATFTDTVDFDGVTFANLPDVTQTT